MKSPFQAILSEGSDANADAPEQDTVGDFLAGITQKGGRAAQNDGRQSQRKALRGGEHTEDDAIDLINAHYFIGRSKEEVAVVRINDDGSATFLSNEQFKLETQNILVARASAKAMPVERYWKESSRRRERTLVFKPDGTTDPTEFNLWRGFSVQPRKGWSKQCRFLRHLFEVICRSDKQKFKYLMRLLAWFVQNPEKHAGVVLVLKSREQGTGKSTVGKVMLDIFGDHGFLVDDKDRLLGRFTDWLATACFVLAEEILFAGDHKSADKMKSMVTGDTLQVERKHGACRQVPNRTKFIATTNHDHAVHAGVRDRRNVVFDVSNKYANDADWFGPLNRDLADGGTSQFFWLLTCLKLGDWHPRMIIRTEETVQQQRMSGDSVSQWAQSCILADAIDLGAYAAALDLGALVSSSDLLKAYTNFCRQSGQRPLSPEVFGKACTDMFGPRRRLRAQITATIGASRRRPWGYHVPKASKWLDKIETRLGVAK